ncbi:MAG: hypothetical protein K2Q01_03125, partial [Rickettsiales bacterium]|nr:hypothetical protein [Rickettsiales bacterium]
FTSYTEEETYWLERVGLAKGDKKVEIVEPFKATESSEEWRLVDNGKVSYFQVCHYRNTSVALKKPLDKELKACRVLPKANPANPHGPQVLHQFECL